MPFEMMLAFIAVLFVILAYLGMLGKFREKAMAELVDSGMNERVAATVARIERLPVPPDVMRRAQALLAAKGVLLDDKQNEALIQGFKDFLIAVVYNRYIVHSNSRNHAVSMTSDTVDMLWHAWLEDAAYEKTFTDLLGFALVHLPEDPEKVAPYRGEGKLDFLKSKPHGRAAETYHALQAALPLVRRQAYASALYLLDKQVRNPQGFYYTGAILLSLGQTDIGWRPEERTSGVYAPASNCADAPPVKHRSHRSSGTSSCGTGCAASGGIGGQDCGGGHDSGAGHGCSSGGSCTGGH